MLNCINANNATELVNYANKLQLSVSQAHGIPTYTELLTLSILLLLALPFSQLIQMGQRAECNRDFYQVARVHPICRCGATASSFTTTASCDLAPRLGCPSSSLCHCPSSVGQRLRDACMRWVAQIATVPSGPQTWLTRPASDGICARWARVCQSTQGSLDDGSQTGLV